MLFNSLGYVLFLTAAVSVSWLAGNRFRPYVMGAFSLLFYALWRWDFMFLVLFSAGIDFFAAQAMDRTEKSRLRRLFLLISLTTNLGLLLFFKYTYFFYDNLRVLLPWIDLPHHTEWGFSIVLPLGISFYTFQTISYSIDVYRRLRKPTNNFGIFLTYVCFWPQLVAGPILRADEVIPQLVQKRTFQLPDFCYGLKRIVYGLFKKVVIADSLAAIVDPIFDEQFVQMTGPDVWVACTLFGFQIYYDFAGYSDIAIGSARLMGIKFPENFNWPYMARSPRDFWSRWHISLSSWIRDYLYLPLTGQKFQTRSTGGIGIATQAGRGRMTWALFATWFIMGLWHGAGWNFALWGLYHAVSIYLYRAIPLLKKLPNAFPLGAWVLTLMTSFAGWIPFRAQSGEQVVSMFKALFNLPSYNPALHTLSAHNYVLCVILLSAMATAYGIQTLNERGRIPRALVHVGTFLVVAVMSALIIVYLKPANDFIYFQF